MKDDKFFELTHWQRGLITFTPYLVILILACALWNQGCGSEEAVEEVTVSDDASIVSFTCEVKNLVVEFDHRPHDLQVQVRVGESQLPQSIPVHQVGKRLILPNIGVYETPTFVDIVWSSGKRVFSNPCR